MANTIIGKVLDLGKTEGIPARNGSTFYKRAVVLDCSRYDQYTGQQFENYPKLEFVGEKCNLPDQFKVGDLVEISFALSGRRVEKDGQVNYYTSPTAYKMEAYVRQSQAQNQAPVATAQPQPQSAPVAPPPQTDADGEPLPQNTDDLPF